MNVLRTHGDETALRISAPTPKQIKTFSVINAHIEIPFPQRDLHFRGEETARGLDFDESHVLSPGKHSRPTELAPTNQDGPPTDHKEPRVGHNTFRLLAGLNRGILASFRGGQRGLEGDPPRPCVTLDGCNL